MTQGSLAARLRLLRVQRGLTIGEAAERIGIDRHTLGRVERGTQTPHGPTLKKISAGYAVPVSELLKEEGIVGLEDLDAGAEGATSPKVEAPSPPPETSEEGRREEREELDKLRALLADAGSTTSHLALPEKEFERLWEGKSAEQRARINQELLEERRLVKPLLVRWASMPPSKERSRLHRLWEQVYLVRLLLAVERNQAAAQTEAEAARRAGDEARASAVLKAAEEFAKVA